MLAPNERVLAVGELRTVAARGAPAPAAVGGRYERIRSASVNDAGHVVFSADLAGGRAASAVVRVAGGQSTVLARAGEPAAGGGYGWFGGLDLGDDGSLLFHAGLTGCEATEGMFLRTASGIRVLARTEVGSGELSYTDPALISYPLPSGPYFRLAYLAHAADGRTSLVIWPSYGGPSSVLTTGMTVAGGVLEDLSVSRPALAVCAIGRIRRAGGPRRVVLLASEDQVVWGPRLREGGRFPDVGRITRLLEPAGMFIHHGFVTAELDGGDTALVTYSGGSDPEVFARSGDPAPGLPGRCIARFGPPVSNHGLPEVGVCGVACVVDLDDGRSGLWVGGFTSRHPMAGFAVVPVVAGDETDDEPAARVDTFTPIKLTNSGILLLRSSLDIDGVETERLLLLHGLFDILAGGR